MLNRRKSMLPDIQLINCHYTSSTIKKIPALPYLLVYDPVPRKSTETSIDVANLSTGSYVVVFSANGTVVPTKIWRE